MKKQARFWVYHVGAVRLKLKPGQTLRHSHGGATDEGYNWEANSYSFDGKQVVCDWHSDGRDCDGRMTRGGTVVARYCDLAKGHRDEDGITFPVWNEIEASQRDHAAEEMNY